jgi:hypothetical protein
MKALLIQETHLIFTINIKYAQTVQVILLQIALSLLYMEPAKFVQSVSLDFGLIEKTTDV